MLRRFHVASIVNNGAYVCRACRHKQLLSRSQQWRYQSTETATSSDNWIDNFNDLTVAFPQKPYKIARLNAKSPARVKDTATLLASWQKRTVRPLRARTNILRRERKQRAAQARNADNEPKASSENVAEDDKAPAGSGSQRSVSRGFSTDIVDAVQDGQLRAKKEPSNQIPPKDEVSTTVGQLHDTPMEKEEFHLAALDTELISSGDSFAKQDERLPLDPSGRDEKPPFKKESAKRVLASRSTSKRTQRLVKPSLAQRAEAINSRPGWAGLDKDAGTDLTNPLSSKNAMSPGGEQSRGSTDLPNEIHVNEEAQQSAGCGATSVTSKEEVDPPTALRKDTKPKRTARQLIVELKRSKRAAQAEKKAAANSSTKKASEPASQNGNELSPSSEKPTTKQKAKDKVSAAKSSTSGGVKSTTAKSSKTKLTKANKASGTSSSMPPTVATMRPREIKLTPLNVPQPPVPSLQHGLDKVLFNQGIYQLQDSRSRVYNFDPYLQKIMPVTDFDFGALKQYQTSSQDEALLKLADFAGSKYLGSTSSMTSTLAHFHFLLSNFRPVETKMLSRGFVESSTTFTKVNLAPNAIFLRWKNGTYAIDADKEHDGANVLMLLGKSMEKLLTLSPSNFEHYRKENSEAISQKERDAPESFNYTTLGDFLMRSQLDAYDPRLPGTGMFDLKTRAVLSVRMDTEDFQPMSNYEIFSLQGRFESYEREYYDMIRATMLKYMLQVRMGRMDGIFVAYHNVKRIFGFQYIPLEEMDRALHGQTDRCLGDQEFQASLQLLNQALNKATAKFPEQSLRFHFETRQENIEGVPAAVMWVYAEPVPEGEIERIQNTNKAKIAEWERTAMGIEQDEPESTERGPLFATEDQSDQSNQGPLFAHTAVANSTLEDSDAREQAEDQTKLADIPDESAAAESQDETQSTAKPADTASPSKKRQASSHKAKNPLGFASNKIDGNFKPLFVASIMAKTTVGGVACDRPASLHPDDDWEVEYLIQEWEADAHWWARYEEAKARRREALANDQDVDEDVANEAVADKVKEKKLPDSYIRFLQRLSEKGKQFRTKLDALEEGRVPVIVGQPISEK